MTVIRRGIATPDTIAKAMKDKGTPLTSEAIGYGATAEAWRAAFTEIGGDNTEIAPKQLDGKVTFFATDETASAIFNTDVEVEKGNATIVYHISGNEITDEGYAIVSARADGFAADSIVDSTVIFTDLTVGQHTVTLEITTPSSSIETIEHAIEILVGENDLVVDID